VNNPEKETLSILKARHKEPEVEYLCIVAHDAKCADDIMSLFLPVSKHGFHGLFIDILGITDGHALWPAHLVRQRKLRLAGYLAIDAVTIRSASGIIRWYLGNQGVPA